MFFKENCECSPASLSWSILLNGGARAGMKYFLTVIRYGDDFRTMRRYMTQYLNSREYVSLYPLLEEQVLILMRNLLDDPDSFENHIDRWIYNSFP